jgi:hypothetical protein
MAWNRWMAAGAVGLVVVIVINIAAMTRGRSAEAMPSQSPVKDDRVVPRNNEVQSVEKSRPAVAEPPLRTSGRK